MVRYLAVRHVESAHVRESQREMIRNTDLERRKPVRPVFVMIPVGALNPICRHDFIQISQSQKETRN